MLWWVSCECGVKHVCEWWSKEWINEDDVEWGAVVEEGDVENW